MKIFDDIELLQELGILDSDLEHPKHASPPALKIAKLDKIKIIGGTIKTRYTDLLETYYKKSGYTDEEIAYWMGEISTGSQNTIPYFLIPTKGIYFQWLEFKAAQYGITPNNVFEVCLKLSKSAETLLDPINSLTAHTRHIYSRVDQASAFLGREIANILIKCQDVDKDIGNPVMDVTAKFGEGYKPPRKKTKVREEYTSRKYLYVAITGCDAKWLGEKGEWNITSIGLLTERIIKDSKFFFEASLGGEISDLQHLTPIEKEGYTGLYKIMHTLRKLEVQLVTLDAVMNNVVQASNTILAQCRQNLRST